MKRNSENNIESFTVSETAKVPGTAQLNKSVKLNGIPTRWPSRRLSLQNRIPKRWQ